MPSPLESVYQVLRSPAAFFEERPPGETLPVAAGLVVAYTLTLVAVLFLVGSIMAGSVDATVTMDNPDRPPAQICDTMGEHSDSIVAERCDQPEEIERDAGALLQEAVHEFVPFVLIGPFLLWGIGGLVLFAGGRLAAGSPSLGGSFALAGWAVVPEFARLAVVVPAFWVAFRDVTITDPERGVEAVEAALAPIEPILLVSSLLVLAWQWYLLSGGLSEDADISLEAAAVAVGVPLAIFGLLGLV